MTSTKGTILFPTGETKPSRARATLRFKLTGGLSQLPSGPRYVGRIRYPGQEALGQLICDFVTPVSDQGIVQADIFFHGDNPPPLAFKTGTKFSLLAGDLEIATGVVSRGESAPAPGFSFVIPPESV